MAGSFCTACGAQYPQPKTQCPNCGAAIKVPAPHQYPPAPPVSRTTKLVLVGMVVGLGLIMWLGKKVERDINDPKPIPNSNPGGSANSADLDARVSYFFMNDEAQPIEKRKHFAAVVIRLMPGTKEAREAQSLLAELAENPENPKESGDWSYIKATDELSGRDYRLATLRSSNTFVLEFPYAGEQHGTLTLRHHPKMGRDVLVEIERGQILCHINDCRVEIAFDDKPPRNLQAAEPESRESTTVFLPTPQRFFKEIAAAKEMRVRLVMFNHPPVTLTFKVQHLDLKALELAR